MCAMINMASIIYDTDELFTRRRPYHHNLINIALYSRIFVLFKNTYIFVSRPFVIILIFLRFCVRAFFLFLCFGMIFFVAILGVDHMRIPNSLSTDYRLTEDVFQQMHQTRRIKENG